MTVPTNPVRIYTSANLGAQQITSGALDPLNMLKQVVGGTFTTIQTLSVQIVGTKAVFTCADAHGLYPYQVIKLTNTGTTLEGFEFFVLNDENLSAIKFAVELGEDATTLPNVISITLPSLGWDIVEDSTQWLSFRPKVDKRIPLWRFSKTANNPSVGARRVYSTYLARDVAGDGTDVRNYTEERFFGHHYSTAFNETQPCGWMVIANDTFMYVIFNRPLYSYSNNVSYSFLGQSDFRFRTGAMIYQYGVPSVILENVLPEWITYFNCLPVGMKNAVNLNSSSYTSGLLVLRDNANAAIISRKPFTFNGATGTLVLLNSYTSGKAPFPYPSIGGFGVYTAKHLIATPELGVVGYVPGCRSLVADIRDAINSVRSWLAIDDVKVHKDLVHMGLLEVGVSRGDQPMVMVVGSSGEVGSQYSDFGWLGGIRVGCSWLYEDTQGA